MFYHNLCSMQPMRVPLVHRRVRKQASGTGISARDGLEPKACRAPSQRGKGTAGSPPLSQGKKRRALDLYDFLCYQQIVFV